MYWNFSLSPERLNSGQNRPFLSRVTLKFNRWPWKTIEHFFYTSSSFVHHFKAMSEFKLALQSGSARFGSISAIFCPVWPWNLVDDLQKQYGSSSTLHQALCIISKPWVNSNWSYSTEMANSGQNRRFFFPCHLEFNGWPWKTIMPLFYIASIFVHHFIAISEFEMESQCGNAQFGPKSMFFYRLNLTDDLEKQ